MVILLRKDIMENKSCKLHCSMTILLLIIIFFGLYHYGYFSKESLKSYQNTIQTTFTNIKDSIMSHIKS